MSEVIQAASKVFRFGTEYLGGNRKYRKRPRRFANGSWSSVGDD